MSKLNNLAADIKQLKAERKQVKKEQGKRSIVYAELTEELDGFKGPASIL